MANRKSWRRAVAPSSSPRPTHKQSAPAFAGVADPALNTLLTALVAHKVIIRTIDGAEYTGLFSGTALSNATPSTLCLNLRYASTTSGTFAAPAISTDIRAGVARSLSLPVTHIALLSAAAPFATSKNTSKSFATDGQISRGGARPGRALQRFDDFGEMVTGNDKPLDEQTFGDLAVNGSTKWDQFQVNHDKFGVTTTFDEEEYTTKIDRGDIHYEEREREAARLAEEIEAKGSDNVHMREERNQDLGADYDEETLYSGVIRTEPAKSRTATSVGRPASQMSVPSRLASQTQSTARATSQATAKDAPKESKRLSYAAAAANSMKTPSGTTVGTKSAPQQQQVSSGATAISSGAKQVASGGSNNAPPLEKNASLRSSSSSVSPPPLGVNHHKAAPPSKAAGSTKAAAPGKSTPEVKAGAPSKASALLKNNTTAHSSSATTNASSKQKQVGSKLTGAAVENKDREALEKKSKLAAARERSSRENLPQLAKVRASITGRTSPNQSRNSPLPSPATTDSSAVAVLNLDAQTPNIGPEQIKSFEQFKWDRERRSIMQNRGKITDDLRKFSTQLESKSGPLRRTNSNSNSSGAISTTTATEKKVPETPKIDEETIPEKTPEQKPVENKNAKQVPDEVPTPVPDANVTKPKPKIKSKLNPNAQEFKMNPDAPSFTPAPQEQPSMNPAPQTYNMYGMTPVMPDYSQPLQSPQAYPVPMQAMGQIPYSQPYGVLLPGAVPTGVGAPNSAYQFMPPGSFAPSQMAGRFPQNTGVPVSYGYGQMNPTMPMVMAAAPQRIPSGPYGYYNSGTYPGGQVAGGPQIPPQAQQPIFVPANQAGGVTHMQPGSVGMGGRGGYGHARRGGGGRRGGKHQSQHGVGGTNGANNVEKAVTKVTENGVATEAGQR